jgi:hypothetical protein
MFFGIQDDGKSPEKFCEFCTVLTGFIFNGDGMFLCIKFFDVNAAVTTAL